MSAVTRRAVAYASALTITAGAVTVGWYGWQVYGTTWKAKQEHASIVSSLEEAWAKPGAQEAEVATAIIRIPAFGSDYAVPVLEGTSDDALARGFGHFTGSAEPGEVGNYAIAGHRVTHGEPLKAMRDLEVGDQVAVETAEAVHTYELTTAGDALEVDLSEGWVTTPLPRNPRPNGVQPSHQTGQRLITLTTCAEFFRTNGRLAAFGVLVATSPRTTPKNG